MDAEMQAYLPCMGVMDTNTPVINLKVVTLPHISLQAEKQVHAELSGIITEHGRHRHQLSGLDKHEGQQQQALSSLNMQVHEHMGFCHICILATIQAKEWAHAETQMTAVGV